MSWMQFLTAEKDGKEHNPKPKPKHIDLNRSSKIEGITDLNSLFRFEMSTPSKSVGHISAGLCSFLRDYS
jgi:hypothetical protein